MIPDFDAKMVQVLHVYKQVEMWREKGTAPPDLVAVLSYDEKPGIQALENTAADLRRCRKTLRRRARP